MNITIPVWGILLIINVVLVSFITYIESQEGGYFSIPIWSFILWSCSGAFWLAWLLSKVF